MAIYRGKPTDLQAELVDANVFGRRLRRATWRRGGVARAARTDREAVGGCPRRVARLRKADAELAVGLGHGDGRCRLSCFLWLGGGMRGGVLCCVWIWEQHFSGDAKLPRVAKCNIIPAVRLFLPGCRHNKATSSSSATTAAAVPCADAPWLRFLRPSSRGCQLSSASKPLDVLGVAILIIIFVQGCDVGSKRCESEWDFSFCPLKIVGQERAPACRPPP
jgi:hypothetical protein